MKFGIIRFPGSNCDADCFDLISKELNMEAAYLWHEDTSVSDCDCIIIPGGFSFGDYLRTGALASLSPIMKAVKEFAYNGGLVLGICNGFQILTEAGLLPGVLLKNRSQKFICRNVALRVENINTPFTNLYTKGEIVYFPIAHGDGCYYTDKDTCDSIEKEELVVFRYANNNGDAGEKYAPNGSINGIAGVINKNGNVLGLMPHPERASSKELNNIYGIRLWKSIMNLPVKLQEIIEANLTKEEEF